MFCIIADAQQTVENQVSNSQSLTQEVYVVGKVFNPMIVPFQESISLVQAIHQAGGTILAEKKSRAIITRRLPNCESTTVIVFDLRDVLARRTTDVLLQPNDIVEVKERTKEVNYNKIPSPCRPSESKLPTVIYSL